MKRFFPSRPLLAFLLSLFLLPLSAYGQELNRKRVAVVLSGGGVKGTAHIGVLKVLEEEGIPIDMVVGTSMGAIVGGLYSIGYTTTQLDSLIRAQDWSFVLSDRAPREKLSLSERESAENYLMRIPLSRTSDTGKKGFIEGINLENLLARLTVGYHDPIAYNRLPTPFACVATNLSNGSEVVMHSGVLAQSIRASMSLPGVFSPVKMHNMTLVDGGLTNNFPADVARRMGADIIIGVTLQKEFEDTTQFANTRDILDQVISIACRNKFSANINITDLHFRIPAYHFSTMDFSAQAIDSLLRMGYEYADARRGSIDSLRHIIYGNDSGYSVARGRITEEPASVHAAQVIFEGILPREAKALRRTCRMEDGRDVSFTQIEEVLRLLREKFDYTDANYRLTASTQGYILRFTAGRKARSTVGVGARFDLEENASLLLGGHFVLPTGLPSRLTLRGKLGEQYSIRLGYSIEPRLYRQLNAFYELRQHDIDVYDRGHQSYTARYKRHLFGLTFDNLRIRNLAGEIGLRASIFDYSAAIYSVGSTTPEVEPGTQTYYSAFFRLKYNSQNRAHYATAGSQFSTSLSFTTDRLSSLSRPHAFTAIAASWHTNLRAATRLTIEPGVAGRLLLGGTIPYPFRNAFGSFYDGKYVEQQLAFPGMPHLNPARDLLAISRLALRYNIHGNHYLSLIGAVGAECDKLADIHRARYFYGFAARYGLLTKAGPIEGELGYSPDDGHVRFFAGVGYYF